MASKPYQRHENTIPLILDGEALASDQVERPATQWSHDDCVNYESARELIVLLMAYRSEWISRERLKLQPDLALIASWSAERSAYAGELRGLDVGDRDNIARIRRDYGAEARRLAALER